MLWFVVMCHVLCVRSSKSLRKREKQRVRERRKLKLSDRSSQCPRWSLSQMYWRTKINDHLTAINWRLINLCSFLLFFSQLLLLCVAAATIRKKCHVDDRSRSQLYLCVDDRERENCQCQCRQLIILLVCANANALHSVTIPLLFVVTAHSAMIHSNDAQYIFECILIYIVQYVHKQCTCTMFVRVYYLYGERNGTWQLCQSNFLATSLSGRHDCGSQ